MAVDYSRFKTNDPTNPLHRLAEDIQKGRVADASIAADIAVALDRLLAADGLLRIAIEALEEIERISYADSAEESVARRALAALSNPPKVELRVDNPDFVISPEPALRVTDDELAVLLEVLAYAGDEVANTSAANSLFLKAEALSNPPKGVGDQP